MSSIVTWVTAKGETPYTLASRHNHFKVLERLNMALLVEEAPHLSEERLNMYLEVYGVKGCGPAEGGESNEIARRCLVGFLKKDFGLEKNDLPLF